MEHHSATSSPTEADVPIGQVVSDLARFDGAPVEFLRHLVKTQCEVAVATGGAVLAVDGEGRVGLLVIHPPPQNGEQPPSWIEQSAAEAPDVLESNDTRIVPLRGTGSAPEGPSQLILLPLRGAGGSRAVATYLFDPAASTDIDRARERLELTSGLLSLYEMRLAAQSRQSDFTRLRMAMEVLDAINEHRRFKAAAFEFCNEVAARWGAERVTLGILNGRYVKTCAISHTEKFDRKMKLVQSLESAMEESFDQDVEIFHPPADDATFVSRAAGELSLRHGPTSIATMPLRHDGEPVAVVTMERALDRPMELDQLEILRLTCDLCTARLIDLHDNDKWIGAKAADSTKAGLSKLVGPRHTWAKAIALLVFLVLLFAVFATGRDRVDASFQITSIEKRLVPAPFDGRLQTVHVEPGDPTVAGVTVLATLDTAELQLQLAAARAQLVGYAKEEDLALRDNKAVEVQMAQSNMNSVQAQIDLLEDQIARARITVAIDGTVTVGDLKRQLGSPVTTGDILFEVAPLDSLRAELEVPEERISDVIAAGNDTELARGTLASVSHPGDYVPFVIERIDPIAQVVEQQNVFKVQVRLLETRPWMRPGMKGVAKIDVGRRRYVAMWTRKMVNWVRMKLWV